MALTTVTIIPEFIIGVNEKVLWEIQSPIEKCIYCSRYLYVQLRHEIEHEIGTITDPSKSRIVYCGQLTDFP